MKQFYKNFKSVIAFVAIMLVMCTAVFAQYRPTGYVTVGTGTQSDYRVPINTFYNYSYTQQIYPAATLQASLGSDSIAISGIAYEYILTESETWPLTVWMANTSQASFAATASSFVDVADMTQVFNGSINFSQGWVQITFDTPFVWDGTSNIVIGVNATLGDYMGASASFRYTTTTGAQSIAVYRDSPGAYVPAEVPTSGLSAYSYNYYPNIRFYCNMDCEMVTGLSSSNVTSNSAHISWAPFVEATAAEVAYSIDGSNYTVVGTVADTAYDLSNLLPNTMYSVRVRAFCGGDSYGAGEVTTFRTGCASYTITPEAPFTEDFESYTGVAYYASNGTYPNCWDLIYTGNSTTYNPHVCTANSYSPANSQSLMLYPSTSSSYGPHIYAILPEFSNDLNTLQVRFAYSQYGSTDYARLSLGYMTDVTDSTTFVSLLNLPHAYYGSNRYNEVEYDITASNIPAGARLAFRAVNLTSSSDYTFIDDVMVRIQPTCRRPVNFAVANVTSSSASFGWTSNSDETTWEISLNDEIQTVTSNPVTLNTLTANTDYVAKVRARCSSTDSSDWSATVSFTTLCEGLTITEDAPYTENFDSYTASSYSSTGGETPDCWTFIYTGTSAGYAPHVSTSNTYVPFSGSQALFLTAYNSTSYGPRTFAVLPAFTNELNTLQVSFYHTNYSSSNYSRLSLGYMTDPSDSTTFVALTQVPHIYYGDSRENYFEYNIVDQNIPAGALLALRALNTQSYTDYIFIDSVKVRIQPTCLRPSNVEVNTIYVDSAMVTWESPATSWEVEYGNTGFFHGTGTSITTNEPSCTLNGLTANTTYDVYVRALCSETDMSEWSMVRTFSNTPCTPAPTSVDNNGISRIWFGESVVVDNTTHPTSSPYYADNTAMVGDAYENDMATVNITFATGYTYGTVIWVNWNNDITFTDNEVVYTGTSANANPTTLTCTFPIPAGTPLGTYTMRIGTADSGLDSQISAGSGYTPCYTGYYSIFEDYTLQISPAPTCPRPLELEATNITSTTAQIDWEPRGEETSWELVVNGVPQVVNAHPYTLTDLNPASDYEISVRAICSETDSSTFCHATFTTACGIVYITETNSYVQGFEGSTFPPICWSVAHTAGSSTSSVWQAGTAYSHNGSKSAYLPDQSTGNKNNLVTCQVNIPDPAAYQVRWWQYRSNYASIKNKEGVKVWVNTTPDTVGGTVIEYIRRQYTLEPVVSTVGWYEYEAVIPTSGTMYVIFEGISEYGAGSYIDDVVIEKAPTCIKPRNIAASQVGTDQATISWLCVDTTQTLWEISYNASSVIANTNPFVLTGLTSNTDYTINVRAICSDVDTSMWANTTCSFTTLCDAMTLSDDVVYFDDFESYSASNSISDANADRPDCWDFLFNGNTASYIPHIYSSSTYTNDKVLMMTTASTTTFGTNVFSLLPTFTNNLGDLEIDFDVAMSSSMYHNLSLGYMTDAEVDSTFVELQAIPRQYYVQGYRHYEIYIDQFGMDIPDGARLAFRWAANSSSSYYVFIDNVRVKVAPDCRRPQNVAVSAITMDGGTITWSPVGNETQWEVTVGNAIDTIVNDTTVVITGLDATTHYNVAVRAYCSATEQSEWTPEVDFMTLCDAITITMEAPYMENFDGYQSSNSISTFSEQPDCWNFFFNGDVSGYAPHVYNGSYAPNAGNNAIVMTSGSADYGNPTLSIFPAFTNPLNSLEVSFSVKMESSSSGSLAFGYISDAQDATTFTTLENIANTTSATEYTFALNEFTIPANTRLAFQWTMSSSFYSVAIDDIDVHMGCEAPTNVTVDAYNTITWESEASSWNLMYVVNNDTTVVHAANNIYTLTNLPDDALVTVMVQAICDPVHSSPWTDPVQFSTTPCEVPTNVAIDDNGNITWESDAAGWNLRYTINGEEHTAASSSTTYHINGLVAGDVITCSVQSVCISGAVSEWSQTVTHTQVGISNYTMNEVQLFPNPTTGLVSVQLSNINDASEVQVADIYGRKLFAGQIDNVKFDLDLSAFAPGVYFVRFVKDSMIVKNVKVVKE